jgi:pyrroline-5-carboxylate reductase
MQGIAVVGGGAMGEALIAGLLRADPAPVAAADIAVVERDHERAAALRREYGVGTPGLAAAMDAADTVFVLVKPYHMEDALAELKPLVTDRHVVVSAAGGTTIGQIETALGGTPAVIRCMPNTPVAVGQGMIALTAGAYAEKEALTRVIDLLSAAGDVVEVPEQHLDAVTALSGSGPAYLFLLAEAMTEAGVHLGLTRSVSERMVTQTMAGAGALLLESNLDAAALRSAVSSPGGTTVAALRVLEDRGFRAALLAATAAGRTRSIEMGRS